MTIQTMQTYLSYHQSYLLVCYFDYSEINSLILHFFFIKLSLNDFYPNLSYQYTNFLMVGLSFDPINFLPRDILYLLQ